MSILLGRVPAMRLDSWVKTRSGVELHQGRYVGTAVYAYAESGKCRLPFFKGYIDGSAVLSIEFPILYIALKFPEAAPMAVEHGVKEQMLILVPKKLMLK